MSQRHGSRGESGSSRAGLHTGKVSPGVGTLSWVSQAILCGPGVPRACARAHLRAWALSVRNRLGPLPFPLRVGTPLIPELPGGLGKSADCE